MFLESLLETSTQAKNRRGWATLISFLIETAAIGVLILVPMLYTDALPSVVRYVEGVSMISPPPGQPEHPNNPPDPPGTKEPAGRDMTEFDNNVLRLPPVIPPDIYEPKEPEKPLGTGKTPECIGCVPGGTGDPGARNAVLDGVLSGGGEGRQVAAPPVNKPVPVPSVIIEGMLIRRVQPIYPQLAITTRTQGAVVVRAIIGRDGAIRQLQVASGHPLLVPAAVDAIRQWRYRPYYLNKQTVEVETEITVNFVLNR